MGVVHLRRQERALLERGVGASVAYVCPGMGAPQPTREEARDRSEDRIGPRLGGGNPGAAGVTLCNRRTYPRTAGSGGGGGGQDPTNGGQTASQGAVRARRDALAVRPPTPEQRHLPPTQVLRENTP